MYNIKHFGAIADEHTINTSSIRTAIEKCREAGGGTVYIPTGVYKTGSIQLYSNMTLFLEAGAVLSFVNDVKEYPVIYTRWEGTEEDCYMSCIYGENVENVSITGHGTLEGNGKFWWDLFRKKENQYPRPTSISFVESKHITISGIKVKNSPSWTIHPLKSENVTIDNVTIINPKDSPNTDGINPESCINVKISNCYIDVGDDCIAIKAGVETANVLSTCKNIAITNCTMVNGHGGVVIGSEMSGNVENVVISNCVFEGTDRGIRLKSRRGRGGIVKDITVSNIIMSHVICPFIMNLYYRCGPKGEDPEVSVKHALPVNEGTPRFQRIYISNITAKNVTAAAGFIYGLAEMYVEDVHFSNVNIYLTEKGEPGLPAMMLDLEPMQQAGFFCRNAKNVSFTNVQITGTIGAAYDIGEECDVLIS